MIENLEKSTQYFKKMSRVMLYLDTNNVKGINKFKEYFAQISSRYIDILAKTNTNIYKGTNNSQNMYAYTENSTIISGDGNDNISGTFKGHSGNEYFYGGKGNDTISGGVGSDTYFFNLGDGQDTIYESSNQNDFNTIVFGEGITKENIEVRRLNQSDVILEIRMFRNNSKIS